MSSSVPIEIHTSGLVLRGEYHAGKSLFAVLVHDQGEDLDSWRDIPDQLAAHSISVIAFDLRGHGGSDGEPDPGATLTDIEAALDTARTAGGQAVVVVAGGVSGSIALDWSSADGVIAIAPLAPSEEPSPTRAHARLVVATSHPDVQAAATALQTQTGRRTLLANVPTPEAGLEVLAGRWGSNISGYILAFIRRIGLELSAKPGVAAKPPAGGDR